jgi:hypothetical protein
VNEVFDIAKGTASIATGATKGVKMGMPQSLHLRKDDEMLVVATLMILNFITPALSHD